jgi:sulfur carrier protein ThiS
LGVKVKLRNPDREVDVMGDRSVQAVLADLGVNPDTVLVIRSGALITRQERVDEDDVLEVRPVISGGARP